MMVQFSIMPISDQQHLSEPIAKAMKIVHDSKLEYRLTPMGTLLKGDWQEVVDVIKQCHEAIAADFDRVTTQIKIDDIKDASPDFDHKINSVEAKASIAFKK